MSGVQRFDPCDDAVCMRTSDNGEFVLFADYTAREDAHKREVEGLRAEAARLQYADAEAAEARVEARIADSPTGRVAFINLNTMSWIVETEDEAMSMHLGGRRVALVLIDAALRGDAEREKGDG